MSLHRAPAIPPETRNGLPKPKTHARPRQSPLPGVTEDDGRSAAPVLVPARGPLFAPPLRARTGAAPPTSMVLKLLAFGGAGACSSSPNRMREGLLRCSRRLLDLANQTDGRRRWSPMGYLILRRFA